MLVSELKKESRLLEILHDRVSAYQYYDEQLLLEIEDFISEYLEYHRISISDAQKHYMNFIKSYNKDAKKFERYGKYPLELDPERTGPGRLAYSVILLFSCLFNPHRFRIMQLIKQQQLNVEKGLFVGCGPGLELALCSTYMDSHVAYDLDLDDFLEHRFPSTDFRNVYFDGSGIEKYDSIFLIEILEHLDKPYDLLAACYKVMKPGSRIYLTTATNIPQFDHLYNFEHDHTDFEREMRSMNFSIVFSEKIPHQVMTQGVGASNSYYILSK